MFKKSFVDETFDYNMTSHYELSIQLSLDGFSFLVYDVTRSKFIACLLHPLNETDREEPSTALKKVLAQSDLTQYAYRQVRVINQTHRYTLIPEAYFSSQRIKECFSFNHKLGDAEELHATELPYYKVVVVHALSSNLTNLLRQYFPTFQIFHQTLPFLKRVELANTHEVCLGVNVTSEYMDLALLQGPNKMLKLLKSYPYTTSADVIYWLLSVTQKQKIQFTLPILFNGDFPNPSYKESIKKEFSHAKWLSEQSNEYTLSYQFHQISLKTIANQLNLVHCE
ncbi:MAG: DUF3822 family protein [Bacteroidales bacterium]